MSNITNFFFFCNSTPEIGLGHFSRCRRIASMLENLVSPNPNISFVGMLSNSLKDEIKKLGWTYYYAKYFECELLPRNAIAIVDSYLINNSSLLLINQHFDKTVFIDDFNRHDFSETDLVINFRFDFDFSSYSVAKGCFGPDYFPADQTMINVRNRGLNDLAKKNDFPLSKILIYLGAQSNELCQKVLDQIDKLYSGLDILFVKGLEHERQCLTTKNNRLDMITLNGPLSSILSQSDAVICSGGLMKYEAAFCLKPNACINQTLDQQSDTILLEKRLLTTNFGMGSELIKNTGKFEKKMNSFLNSQTLKKQRLAMKDNFSTKKKKNAAQAILDLK